MSKRTTDIWWAKEPTGIISDNAVIVVRNDQQKEVTFHLQVDSLGRYIRQIRSGYILETKENLANWSPLALSNLRKEINAELLGDVVIEGDVIVHVGESALSNNSYVIPTGVREIGSKCFYGLRNLKNVYIPDTVRYIRSSAFNGSGVEELILPESIRLIGPSAFANCLDLKWIECANCNVHACLKMDQLRNTPKLLEIILMGQPRMKDPYKKQEEEPVCNKVSESNNTQEKAEEVAKQVGEAVSKEMKNLNEGSSVINITVNCYFPEAKAV